MSKATILFSTTDGHTIKISEKIRSVLEKDGYEVSLLPIADAKTSDFEDADRILIGAAIRYGKHKKEVFEFIKQYKDVLESKISAFFTVNVVARKANKNTPETNPYLKKFLSKVPWKPDVLGVFAGKIDYQRYGFFDRSAIRFIMFITKGPTNPDAVVEFTDWGAVEAFGKTFSEMRKGT